MRPFFSAVGLLNEDLLDPETSLVDTSSAAWLPDVDVLGLADHYLVLIDLPGVDPASVRVEVKRGLLTVSGRRPQLGAPETFRLERPLGRFRRTVRLPAGCDGEQISADLSNGVLEVKVGRCR